VEKSYDESCENRCDGNRSRGRAGKQKQVIKRVWLQLSLARPVRVFHRSRPCCYLRTCSRYIFMLSCPWLNLAFFHVEALLVRRTKGYASPRTRAFSSFAYAHSINTTWYCRSERRPFDDLSISLIAIANTPE
jgi:hypothetical protein